MNYSHAWAHFIVQKLGWIDPVTQGPDEMWIWVFAGVISSLICMIFWLLGRKKLPSNRWQWPLMAFWLFQNMHLFSWSLQIPGLFEIFRFLMMAYSAWAGFFFIQGFLGTRSVETWLKWKTLQVTWVFICAIWFANFFQIQTAWMNQFILPVILGFAYIGREHAQDFISGFLLRREFSSDQDLLQNKAGESLGKISAIGLWRTVVEDSSGQKRSFRNHELWKSL